MRVALVLIPAAIVAQGQPPATPPPGGAAAQSGRGGAQGRRAGGPPRPNFPQQQRALADASVLARGKGLYESNCSACHGIDLRGGQQGGPNLLRSQVVLLDKEGELIAQVVSAGRPKPAAAGATPMPAFSFPAEDVKAIAEYLHSVAALGGAQGRPPVDTIVAPERILVGDAAAGRQYFSSHCSSCHSVDADLKGIATRAGDPRELQNLWVSGGGGGRGGGGGGGRAGRGGAGAGASGGAGRGTGGAARAVTVTITPAAGLRVEGRLARIDDFTVSVFLEDGTRRTFVRRGVERPRVEIHDPAAAHRTLVQQLSDTDMHNVTAYLWSIK